MKKVNRRLWAEFRFQVIGQLLAAPPTAHGELRAELTALAARQWAHPVTGDKVQISVSTIERWLGKARRARTDTVEALTRKRRSDASGPRLPVKLADALTRLHRDHPSWTAKLLFRNLVAVAERDALPDCPSYQTVRRYLRSRGMVRQRRPRRLEREAERQARLTVEQRETRSYEASHVGGLWHLDFHHARRQIVAQDGALVTPIALAVIDDRSRLICHVQWYLGETTADLVHGFGQALMRRGLPRALMSDNGSAMTSAEFTEGLLRLGITHETTLRYSPHQNGKIESFWGVLEGQLMAMLDRKNDLTLDLLNRATLSWVEMDYHREIHSETKEAPSARFLAGPSELRPSPDSARLRDVFRTDEVRVQRKSDGTVTLGGVRFEVPDRLRHIQRLVVRYARWDLSKVDVVCEHSGQVQAPLYPLDKAKNADAKRRIRAAAVEKAPDLAARAEGEIAPHLAALMRQYTQTTGLPPAFIPQS